MRNGATKLARKLLDYYNNTTMVQDRITIDISKVSTINKNPYNIVYTTNNYNYITSPSFHKHTYIGYYIITYIAISTHNVQLLQVSTLEQCSEG